ncbi:phosphatase PAP2 family protein [Nonomuraea sp. NPDC046570]|uniref:phosphatase PAP2 family protein n=1 Tax=Nonomuraea sp. NPDC046570 TaxID=3155255 RepID=UPI0033F25D72
MFARRHLDPDRRLGLRLTAASLLVGLVMIPFTLLAVLVKTAFPPLHLLDKGVARDLHAFALRNPVWTDVVTFWSELFGPWPWRIVVIALAGWLIYRGAPRLATWAITTITVGGLLALAIKIVTDRARPAFPDPVAMAPGQSFPSGHVVNATLGAGIVVLLLLPVLSRRGRTIAWSAAGFLVVSMAYTRIALGVHWVSDAVAGALLGVAVIAATAVAFESWRRELGRRPAVPYAEGVEPEAEEEISTGGRAYGSRH